MALQQVQQEKHVTAANSTTVEGLSHSKGFVRGLLLTLVLAIIAGQLAKLPFLSIMGIMILSILLGMSWKSVMSVPTGAAPGITFSSKILLRAGIILMGLRLNLEQIVNAGLSVFLIDVIVIAFTLVVMMSLGKALSIDKHLSALIAVGTAVCGAAAIVAVAPLIKGKKEYTALAVACIAILGTVGAILYILLYPLLGLNSYSYGVLVGATLHELAHVIAAAIPGGEVSSETALLVKLGRVALLIPVALILGFIFSRNDGTKTAEKKSFKDLPVPWFIFGFLAMSVVNTLQLLSASVTNALIFISIYLLSMAMAGLGLSINFGDFKKVGIKPVIVGILGFMALSLLSPFLLYLL
ncbi:YeiH family protein [Bacillus taeanensis]|uniref:Putative sulfate exporter family transporter n=1 Tax=Bacillus taeanensis TaxID=273032 RepID=A0A366XUR5_9BACI|nr:YeiH family protein [Bacillus taeanensis]RBW70130.1 putative sulfate exporter family transporter [Bacillus taeanensis]